MVDNEQGFYYISQLTYFVRVISITWTKITHKLLGRQSPHVHVFNLRNHGTDFRYSGTTGPNKQLLDAFDSGSCPSTITFTLHEARTELQRTKCNTAHDDDDDDDNDYNNNMSVTTVYSVNILRKFFLPRESLVVAKEAPH
jgi:hypothetical protein